MNNVGEILCLRIYINEDKPLKIKSIAVETEELKKQRVSFESNRILKCGTFCSQVFCKNE